METWPSVLPAWSIGYSSSYRNAVARTSLKGKVTQERISQRNNEIVSASLRLYGAELPLFEYFVQEILNEGQDFFTGTYLDNGVTESGSMRIVGGRYQVQAITTSTWAITCNVEVVRDHA